VKNRDSVAVDRNANEEFDFLDEHINLAVKHAQQNLIDLGIDYVYSIDNLVIQHNSNGSEDILQSID
jgi:hypothetical protein